MKEDEDEWLCILLVTDEEDCKKYAGWCRIDPSDWLDDEDVNSYYQELIRESTLTAEEKEETFVFAIIAKYGEGLTTFFEFGMRSFNDNNYACYSMDMDSYIATEKQIYEGIKALGGDFSSLINCY